MNWLFYSIKKKKLVKFNERLINLPLQILKMMTHHTMLVRSTQNGHMLCLVASFAFLKSSSASTEKSSFREVSCISRYTVVEFTCRFIAQGIPKDCLKAVLLIY